MESTSNSVLATGGSELMAKKLCLLSLDGGGFRGLSSLFILLELMESLDPDDPPKPCDVFDMIGGTSTGGLIAIMLGRLKMTVQECIEAYLYISREWNSHNQSAHFQLEFDFKRFVSKYGMERDELFRESARDMKCKTFVCDTTYQISRGSIMSNYSSNRWGNNHVAKIWEAAQATSAAMYDFDGITTGREDFRDMGITGLSPINHLWIEATSFFGQDQADWRLEDHLQCLISIGTGSQQSIPLPTHLSGIAYVWIQRQWALAKETDKIFDEFQKIHSQLFQQGVAFRFNLNKSANFERNKYEFSSEADIAPEISHVTADYLKEARSTLILPCTTRLREKAFSSQFKPLLDSSSGVSAQGEEEIHSSPRDIVSHSKTGQSGQIARKIEQAIQRKLFVLDTDMKLFATTFEISWELQRCIQDELDGDYDLGPVLTISGDSSHFWATSCLEYVEHAWPTVGSAFLELLRRTAGFTQKEEINPKDFGGSDSEGEEDNEEGTLDIHHQLSFETQRRSESSIIRYRGTAEELTTLAEILSWVTATFRLPRTGELCCSAVVFKEISSEARTQLRFSICAGALQPFDQQGRGTCWAPLFPSTVLACGFSVPKNPHTHGLQMSVDGLLEMANVLYDVNFESEDGLAKGIYFDGIAWRLYPTAYIEETNTVQWHLVKKGPHEENHQGLPPELHGRPKWLADVSLDTLQSAIAVLGYCGDAHVYLGTEERKQQYNLFRPCNARHERPLKKLTLGNITLGLGFKPASFSMSFAMKKRKGLVDSRKEEDVKNFSLLLERTREKPVILFDTEKGKEKAWMVSQLSMLLDLYNYWAFRKGLKDVKYAQAGADGGEQAKRILDDNAYVTRVLYEKKGSEDKDLNVADMIMRIYSRFMHRGPGGRESDQLSDITVPVGTVGDKILGWDWLTLIESTPLDESPRLEIPMSNAEMPPWAALTKTMRVLFGDGMGELIKPQEPQDLCRHWYPVPGGLKNLYLVTTIPCVKAREAFGGVEKPGLAPGIVWDFNDGCIFQPCVGCKFGEEKKCIKQPQSLRIEPANSREKLRKIQPLNPSRLTQVSGLGEPSSQIPSNGAVIFAESRKSEKIFSELKAPCDRAGEGSRGLKHSRHEVDDDTAPPQTAQKKRKERLPEQLSPRVNGSISSDLIDANSVGLWTGTTNCCAHNNRNKLNGDDDGTDPASLDEKMMETLKIKASSNPDRPVAALVPEAIKLFFKEHCDSLGKEEQARVLAKLYVHDWADVFLGVGEGDIARQRRDALVELLKK